MKEILLIEPNYKNKYPPLGLMKISTYHKLKGDRVTFFKGCSKELQEMRWDRIYITTLFSFYWKKTVETIKFYKRSVKKTKHFYVGGILATTMYQELINETGIIPIRGLLDKKNSLNKKDNVIIDTLTPDYDILDSIEYKYPTSNSYISYMTRGCCNKCAFCAVPALEPNYIDYISLADRVTEINNKFGAKHNLLLMDNNVLASKHFDKIIDEIKQLGFEKGAKYKTPNLLEVNLNRLQRHYSDNVAINNIKKLLVDFPVTRLKEKPQYEEFLSLVSDFGLLDDNDNRYGKRFLTKFQQAFPQLNKIYEKYRNKSYKSRYIDFNQGLDARKLTEDKMKRLSEINLKPLRIAFDDIKFKEIYMEKIRLAAKYGIKELSNYVLYNFNDTPEELYERLKINIELNKELGLNIFSFPMKYIPINAKDRTFIGEHWNRKFLRTVQVILNVTHGAVMPRADFFEKAFGKNIKEFNNLLLMPEDYIYYRYYAEDIGLTEKWTDNLKKLRLDKINYNKTIDLIYSNNFKSINLEMLNETSRQFLMHYKNRIKLDDFKKWKYNNN